MEHYVRHLLRQIISRRPVISEDIKHQYQHRIAQEPSIRELQALMALELAAFEQV